ncbi:MAG: sugar ABC transporter permease, partial [Propionibacteriaceae bacterium]|nr:sugar ABC transporter permease [Propionibacteriaceae bacterium]
MAGPVVEDATKSGAQQAVPPPVIAHANPYSLGRALAHGDIWTKLSMVVMGLGNIVRGQIIKGAIFLVLEIGFLYLFITQGITTIAHLGVLGPVEKNTQGWVNGVYTNIEATNSIKVLLYGVGWLFIVGAFAVLWTVAVKSSFLVQSVVQKGGKPASFVQDVKDLLDGRIRVTLMSLPFVGLIVFTVLPLVTMILIAFTTFDQNHRVAFNWSGFSTFATVFSPEGSVELGVSLSLFLRVLAWTLVWAFFATFLNFFLGMFMAMIILRKGVRLKGLWRTCFSMSIAVPQFVSLLVIHQMLTQDGIVN